jgi:hypothetical protein
MTLSSIPQSWDFPPPESALPPESVSMIEFLSSRVFNDYEPTQFHPFRQRLIDWLNNVDCPEDQQHLLALLLQVFFVGRKEFEALYRTVYHGNMFRWILEVEGLDVFGEGLEKSVTQRINSAWICPISDSLRINSFLKVNGLKSLDKRPDWRSLQQFGDVQKIRAYAQEKGIKHLVLLEDFVGSGTQAKNVVRFASDALPDVRILLCPLIVCPNGDASLVDTTEALANVTYDPVLVLPSTEFHSYEDHSNGNSGPSDVFICSLKAKMGFSSEKAMFGFKQTGAKVVMYSNCPNNTLPIFHYEGESWKPLFPRVNRQ